MAELKSDPRNATTIEQTSKVYKIHHALSFVLFIIGAALAVAAMAGSSGPSRQQFILAICLMGIAIVWHIVSRVVAWWHHG